MGHLLENNLLKAGSEERGNMSIIYEILYRCVKEDATGITLMMLFFYLLGHMPPMSFKL